MQRALYLLFNEGYAASAGPDLLRPELSAEAIRITRLLHSLVPDDGEVREQIEAGNLNRRIVRDELGPMRDVRSRDGSARDAVVLSAAIGHKVKQTP